MNNENPTHSTDLEVVEPNAIESVSRAEIDISIATARRYPRDVSKVKQAMLSFATLDTETAEACFYSLPRGGKNIQGPSVRLAEIAVSCYGNLRAGSRIISVNSTGDSPHVVVQSVAMDLEKNISVSIEKRRRITKKKFKDAVDEDDINLAANACSSICFRDAVFKVIPMALIKPVFEAAKKVAIGDQKTLVERRNRCLDTFAKMGITNARVLAKVDCKMPDQINLEHLETLMGLFNAIKDGEVQIDEAFPVAVTSAAPTAFQQSQGAQEPVAKAPSAAATPSEPPKVVVQHAPEPSNEPQEAPKRRGRPPGSSSPKKEPEKFTPAEADEIRKTGVPVAPEAIQGEEPPTTTPEQSEEAELAAAGLAPEPTPEPEKAPEVNPNAATFKPVAVESEAVTNLRRICFANGISEEQVMKFMELNRLSAGEKTFKDFTANSRENKLKALVDLSTKPSWPGFLAKIKAM